MEPKHRSLTKKLIILNLAAIAAILYITSIFNAYSVFQQTRIIDPLAELHSMDLLYYFAIVLTALLVLSCLIWHIGNRYLHIILLMVLAAMLWLTPYWLSGFVRLPDAPWHVGVAMQIPRVLSGYEDAFSSYAWGYPGSYIYHYSWVNITGIQPLTYIHFFPVAAMFLFIFLSYVLLARLFNSYVAVLALLLAIPGLHYIQLHASPHVIGALLMLTVLLLLARVGRLAIILAVVVVAAIIISHPTTPLLLVVFLAAALIALIISTRKINRLQLALAGLLVVTFVVWFCYYSYSDRNQPITSGLISTPAQITSAAASKTPKSTPTLTPVTSSITPKATPTATQATRSTPPKSTPTVTPATSPITPKTTPTATANVKKETSFFSRLTGQILPSDLNTTQEYMSGTPFIYQNIYNLNKGIYILYALVAIVLLLYTTANYYIKKRRIRDWLSGVGGIKQIELLMLISLPLLFILTVLLAEGAHDLIETGLTYIILVLSCIIASIILPLRIRGTKIVRLFLVIYVLFITLAYPFVSYSIDAWSNFPKSEEDGLKFLATNTTLEGKQVAGLSLVQLALFTSQYSDKTKFIDLDLTKTKPYAAIFRNTGYYYAAMRFDLSFEDNTYTRSLAVAQKLKYRKIYASPTIEIFLK